MNFETASGKTEKRVSSSDKSGLHSLFLSQNKQKERKKKGQGKERARRSSWRSESFGNTRPMERDSLALEQDALDLQSAMRVHAQQRSAASRTVIDRSLMAICQSMRESQSRVHIPSISSSPSECSMIASTLLEVDSSLDANFGEEESVAATLRLGLSLALASSNAVGAMKVKMASSTSRDNVAEMAKPAESGADSNANGRKNPFFSAKSKFVQEVRVRETEAKRGGEGIGRCRHMWHCLGLVVSPMAWDSIDVSFLLLVVHRVGSWSLRSGRRVFPRHSRASLEEQRTTKTKSHFPQNWLTATAL